MRPYIDGIIDQFKYNNIFKDKTTIGDVGFTLYTMNIFNEDDTSVNNDSDIICQFQGFDNWNFTEEADVPTKTIEGGEMTSDSIINKPYTIDANFWVAPNLDIDFNNYDYLLSYKDNITEKLRQCKNNGIKLALLPQNTLYKTYDNVLLVYFNDIIIKDRQTMLLYLKFKRCRSTQSKYANVKREKTIIPDTMPMINTGRSKITELDNNVIVPPIVELKK